MVVQAKQSWFGRIRDFFGTGVGALTPRADGHGRRYLFGIGGRMLLFIALLIALGYGISYAKTRELVHYVIAREKVDLQDESRNKKLAMELALQGAYTQIISNRALSSASLEKSESREKPDEWPRHLELEPLNAGRGIAHAYVEAFIPPEDLLSHSVHLIERFDVAQLRELAENKNFATLWSQMYWTPAEKPDGNTSKKAWLQMLHSHPPTRSDAVQGYWLVRYDLTPVVEDLVLGTRQLSYFVGVEHQSKRLWVAPTGNPNHLGTAKATTLPPSLTAAIEGFEMANRNNDSIAQRGYVWSGPDDQQGVSVKQMFAADTPRRPVSLRYSETLDMDPAVFVALNEHQNRVSKDPLALARLGSLDVIAESMQRQDPYVQIDPLNMEVGQIRIRAGSLEFLGVTQLFVLAHVKALVPDAELKWNDIGMDDFVMSVQRVDLPIGSGNENRQASLGYLVRSASLEEIRQSVTRDLRELELATVWAILFAIISALFVSWRLINPLTRMTIVAEQVSKLGQVKSNQIGPELERLLAQLPAGRGTEIGILSKQFEQTTRDLMRAKREAEQAAETIKREQRKVEQSGRERAIATEVSEHLVHLLGSVSHDMRQPLVQISANAERLCNQPDLTPSQRERLSKVLRNTRELDSLIQDILDYNRIIKGDIHLEVSRFELDSLLEEITSHYEDVAEQRSVRMVLSSWWKGTVTTDRLRLKRVLNNLLSNAIRATHDGEVQIVTTAVETDQIEIAIKDTGSGMSEMQQQLIFTFAEERARLLRQHSPMTMRKDANSTGLGLHIAKQLIEKMGGSIRFTSLEGVGTTFIVRMPIAIPQQGSLDGSAGPNDSAPSVPAVTGLAMPESSGPPVFRAMGPPASNGTSTGKEFLLARAPQRAIVVDDDPRCTEILAEMLSELGYECKRVHDGRSALQIINETLPDLVTLDVIMPEIDGWEALQSLKSNQRTEHIPVVMVTVHPDESKATLLGASGFVSKPVQQLALHQSILQAIGERRDARVLVVDDDPACLSELEDLLRPLRCRVIPACNGVEALDRLADESAAPDEPPVDLAIVDLYMPDMDGFALIDKLAEMPHTREVPIIVLSAGVLTEAERAELLPNVARFFGKGSVDLATLRDEIRRLLRKPSQEPAIS